MKETKCEREKRGRDKRKKTHKLIIYQAHELFTIHVES